MRAALLTLLLAVPCGDFGKEVRRVFRPSREPAAVHGVRTRALKTSAKLDADDLEALVDAYVQLEKELAPREDQHLEFLRRGRRDKSREQRPDVDSLRELQESILEHVRAVSEPALAAELCEMAVTGVRWPVSLRLALAETGRALRGDEVEGLVKRARRARNQGTGTRKA